MTFDNLLLPPASSSKDRNGQGDAPMGLSPSRCFIQQIHWAFRDSDTLNHVGGPANSFQAICLVVTWALCSGRPHHLLRLACCRDIPCPVPPCRYHHGSQAAWVRQGRELLLLLLGPGRSSSLEQVVSSPVYCTVRPSRRFQQTLVTLDVRAGFS